MRRLVRTLARSGHDNDVWPVVLVLFAVLIPAVSLLWFMSEAMRNERFAARQKLADAYRDQLSSAQALLAKFWAEETKELERLAGVMLASEAFARCIQSPILDSVLIFDGRGQVAYPNMPSGPAADLGDPEPNWTEANRLEYLKDFAAAARIYSGLAKAATNIHLSGRAWQGHARCLVQAGQKDAAVRLTEQVFAGEQFRQVVDPQGRLIAANAELMQLELIADSNAPLFQSTARRLAERLMDYGNPALAASQRRFLMKELRTLSPAIEFPTLAAEELAAQFLESELKLTKDSVLQRAPFTDLWQFLTPDQRVLALVRADKLVSSLRAMSGSGRFPHGSDLRLIPPGIDDDSIFALLPAGPQLPGWRLGLSSKDQKLFASATEHRMAMYLWSGVLVVAGMGVLTLLAVRLLRRQAALTRLKNDLAATVSHELKTPLASIRVLVDTLLESKSLDEQRVREYLQLIAQEGERLTRLIQNFLAFSKMEQRKQNFDFAPAPAQQIVDAAVEAVRERFSAPGCRFEVQLEADLPCLMADADALATALINLLDNAWKYSTTPKHIVLRVRAEKGGVIFSVQDNGIGIAPRERQKIFQRFYQVDQRLSREAGGCGLGLSIVQFIVAAHDGCVSVESQPGCGSTFAISLPAMLGPAGANQESLG